MVDLNTLTLVRRPLFILPSFLTSPPLPTTPLPNDAFCLEFTSGGGTPCPCTVLFYCSQSFSQEKERQTKKKAGRCSHSPEHVRTVDPVPQLFGCTWSLVMLKLQRATALTEVLVRREALCGWSQPSADFWALGSVILFSEEDSHKEFGIQGVWREWQECSLRSS